MLLLFIHLVIQIFLFHYDHCHVHIPFIYFSIADAFKNRFILNFNLMHAEFGSSYLTQCHLFLHDGDYKFEKHIIPVCFL